MHCDHSAEQPSVTTEKLFWASEHYQFRASDEDLLERSVVILVKGMLCSQVS